MFGTVLGLGRIASDFRTAKCSSGMDPPIFAGELLGLVALVSHSQRVNACCMTVTCHRDGSWNQALTLPLSQVRKEL